MSHPCRVADAHGQAGSQPVKDAADQRHGNFDTEIKELQHRAGDKLLAARNEEDSPSDPEALRLAIVLTRGLDAGRAANAAALLAGGLRCAAFLAPVADADGRPHVAVRANVPVLVAKSEARLMRAFQQALDDGLSAVALAAKATGFSNDFASYSKLVMTSPTSNLRLVGIAIFGGYVEVKRVTRAFSVYRQEGPC